MVGDGDDASAVLEEVLEDGEVGLGRVRVVSVQSHGGGGSSYLVVDLTPCLGLRVVMLKGLEAIDADLEVRGVED